MAENSAQTAAVKRGIGRPFVKGQSGNPGGRPKLDPEVMEAIRAACPEAVQELIKLVHHENPTIALRAITELLDRGYGKPAQVQTVSMDVSGDAVMMAQIRSVLLELLDERGGLKEADEPEETD